MGVCCVFSFESPHRGGSGGCTQYTVFNVNRKTCPNYPKSAATGPSPRDLRASSKQPCQTNHQFSRHWSATLVCHYFLKELLCVIIISFVRTTTCFQEKLKTAHSWQYPIFLCCSNSHLTRTPCRVDILTIHIASQWAHDVEKTSHRRPCDIVTSHRRQCNATGSLLKLRSVAQ